jgi:RimJ/RimL family protein N-acetyltransferase
MRKQAVNKMLLEIPNRVETERLYLRRYEAENVVMSIESEEDAKNAVRELAAEWEARSCFFMGTFDRGSDEFVAQIYVGPVAWTVPEFQIGFFVDKKHEGKGYVAEAVRAALGFVFHHLKAHRVRMECDDTNEHSLRVAEEHRALNPIALNGG